MSDYLATCTAALKAVISSLNGEAIHASDFPSAFEAFEKTRRASSDATISGHLGISVAEFNDFKNALRKLKRFAETGDAADPTRQLNTRIAALRVIDWFGKVSKNIEGLDSLAKQVANDLEKNRGAKQIRAAELIIRSLINETYGSQDKLTLAIRAFFKGNDAAGKIEKNAQTGDILSGTAFSQLVSLFLRREDYEKHYAPLYEPTPFLNFQKNKRDTLALFLEDIRRIRNLVAHHNPLSTVQIELLNIYYDQLVEPIQSAYDEKLTKVDPDAFMEVAPDDLARYMRGLSEDMGEIRTSLDEIQAGVAETNQGIGWLKKNARWLLGGVVLVAAISATSLGLIRQTWETTGDIKADTTEIKNTTRGFDKKLDNVKQETSNDPRKELANRGVPWDEKALETALARGDAEIVELFVRGGLDPMNSSTNASAPIAAIICQPELPRRLEQLKQLGVDIGKFYKAYLGNVEFLGRVTIDENLLAGYLRACRSDDPELVRYLVSNGIKLERDFLEKAGETPVRLSRRLEYAPYKPKAIAALLESNAFDLSARNGELIDFLFARSDNGEALYPVGTDQQCRHWVQTRYPALSRVARPASGQPPSSSVASAPSTQVSMACHAVSIDHPQDMRPCEDLAKDPRYRNYFPR